MLSCMQCVCSQEFGSSGILDALLFSTEYNAILSYRNTTYYLIPKLTENIMSSKLREI